MIRLWYALLLLLALQPTPAAAFEGGAVPGHDGMIASAAEYGQDVMRSSSGLELLYRLDNRSGGPPPSQIRGPGLACPAPSLALSSVRVAALTRATAGGHTPALRDEHSSYYATAPPPSR